MKRLKELSTKHIECIDENMYKVSYQKEDREIIRKAIIKEKSLLAQKKINFSLDDFVLVRITDDSNFPRNFIYYPVDERNSLSAIETPFYPIIGCLHYNIEEYENYDVGIPHDKINYKKYILLSTRYRPTKHFSINSLASNVYRMFGISSKFDTGDFVIIEPLKSRIRDKRLVNLNPVDTFFDLSASDMPVDDKAIFLIRESSLSKYMSDDKMAPRLKKSKIYVFESDPALAVDIVLMHHGIMPQRSKQQKELKVDYYFENNTEINDAEYIRQYKDYFEYLNQFYLHTSYFQVPDKIKKCRDTKYHELLGLHGVLHFETEYWLKEQENNLEADIATYKEYIRYIFTKANLCNLPIDEIISCVIRDVYDKYQTPFERNFMELRKFDKELLSVIQKMTYPTFEKETNNFNDAKKKTLDPKRQG